MKPKGVVVLSKDLDTLVDEYRAVVNATHDLDVEQGFDGECLGNILCAIEEKAKGFKPPVAIKTQSIPPVSVEKPYCSKIKLFLRRFDRNLSNFAFYNRKIRPFLKRRFVYLIKAKWISPKSLVGGTGHQFVANVYQTLLQRAPDEEAIKEFLLASSDGTTLTRLHLIKGIAESQEAKQYNIRVAFLNTTILLLQIKNFFTSIPILGYLLRTIFAICLLVRRMDMLFGKVNDIYIRSQEVNNHINTISQEVNNRIDAMQNDFISKTQKLNEQVSILKQEYDLYLEKEKNTLKTKQYMEERLNKLYIDYKRDLMSSEREVVSQECQHYVDTLGQWRNGRTVASLSVVDLGCGHGELVQRLFENGYNVLGIDSNPYMLDEAKKFVPDTNLVQQDAVQYLEGCPDNSLDVIFSTHMIEHLELQDMFNLFNQSKRVLKPNGLLVITTPNPQNLIVSTYLFRMDITHLNPIPHELLEFLLTEWGFDLLKTDFNRPLNMFGCDYEKKDALSHMSFRFNLEQEYSTWAVKKL